jgi:hypothetical protein
MEKQMTRAKHTPGPWATNGHPIVYVNGGRTVAFCDVPRQRNEENCANAQLIAVAPELLQAAEQFLASVKDGNVSDLIGYYADIFGEAVAKATGEQQ